MKNIEAFLQGMAKLSKETGIVVWGCGCCGSPFLEEATTDDLERGVYRHNDEKKRRCVAVFQYGARESQGLVCCTRLQV